VPVWAESGRRGGYALDAQMTLPPLNFTASEAAAVALALAVAGASPFGESARSGLRKIITGMSPAARRGAADLIGRIRVPDRADPVLAGAAASAVAGVVARAVAEQRVLEIDYVDKAGATSTRRPVEPLGLLGQGAHWYLIAWCRLRAGHRAFRLDRIQAAAMRMESAPPRDLPDFRCEPAIRVRQLAIEP
jgi:predicted DNA-binding transcriptional regulator YafY